MNSLQENNSRKNKMSLLSATLLSTTCMIGSGWLFSSQLSAKAAGNWAFLAWILSAILAGAVGLCLSKVVATFPVRGATTRSSALSHNNIFGMPFAFANWFGIMMTVAAEAQATTQYLASSTGSKFLIYNHNLTGHGKLLALLLLLIYLFINFKGVQRLSKVNNIITVFKIFIPLFTVIIFIIAGLDHSGNTTNFMLSTNSHFGPISAFSAITGAGLLYSFNGFQTSVAYASEIKNPKRNVPLSMLYSILIVLALYLLLQYAFMVAIPHDKLLTEGGWQGLHMSSPLLNLSMLLGLNFMAMLLIADSVISPTGTGYAYLGASSRMLYAMSAEGQMPRWIAKLSPINNFSKRSMLINFLLAAIMLWNANSWSGLMIIVTGFHIIGYMAAPVSMGAITPKTRIWGLIVFVVTSLIMLTLSPVALWNINLSLTTIMIIYAFIQHEAGIKRLLIYTIPFLSYLWVLYATKILFSHNLSYFIFSIVAIIFYIFITNGKYVSYCKEFSAVNDIKEKYEAP
ncbi:MAG: APC family permease [Psychromonas sp.]|nr:APC family permease [Psychromonas sp.]